MIDDRQKIRLETNRYHKFFSVLGRSFSERSARPRAFIGERSVKGRSPLFAFVPPLGRKSRPRSAGNCNNIPRHSSACTYGRLQCVTVTIRLIPNPVSRLSFSGPRWYVGTRDRRLPDLRGRHSPVVGRLTHTHRIQARGPAETRAHPPKRIIPHAARRDRCQDTCSSPPCPVTHPKVSVEPR